MLPLEIVLSPPGIPLEGGGACLLLGYWACCLAPGVQGEGEVRTNGNREVEDLALAGQCLAKVQALGGHGGASLVHSSNISAVIFFKTCAALGPVACPRNGLHSAQTRLVFTLYVHD